MMKIYKIYSYFLKLLNYLDQIKFAYKISSITATNPKSFNVIINKNI